ncbi:TIGR04222 domain-containing membrane protein [Streptomyces sp. NPDC051211]|uniref:TIGR04222 domain-containing membrane protein n=1 Tax=Streptomyces sp. NPDC051211 TaxID=3154643 RepID=UPI00344D6F20
MIVVTVLVWLAVAGSTGYAALGIRRARGPALPRPALLDSTEAAFLTGGPRRVVDAALVSLCYDGRMMIGGPGIVQVRTGAQGHDPVERAVLEVFGGAASGALYPLRSATQTHPAVRETGEGLAARGLLGAPRALSRWRTWAAVQAVLCFLALPTLAVLAAVDLGPALAALPAPLLGIAAAVVLAVPAGSRTTRAGRQALDAYRRAYAHSPDPRVAVSLKGPLAVPDRLLRMQLVRTAPGPRPGPRPGSRPPSRGTRSSSGDGGQLPSVWCAAGNSSCASGNGDSGSPSGSGCSSWSSCAGGSSGSSCASSSGGSGCGSSSSSG